MNLISKHLNKDNLHHAYLIEGARDKITLEIFEFFKSLGVKTSGNPDFVNISIDNFKIDDAFILRTMSSDKSFSVGKKIFLICINNITLDAQNVLLKMFEETTEDTHFFLIVPDVNNLLKTLVSRFYFISSRQGLVEETKNAEKFIVMPLKNRIDFVKELLTEPEEDENGNEIIIIDSARPKALKFLNALEAVLVSKTVFDKNKSRTVFDTFKHFFKVREFLRMPGSSTKSLLESVALITPIFKN